MLKCRSLLRIILKQLHSEWLLVVIGDSSDIVGGMRMTTAEPMRNGNLFRSESQKILMKWLQEADIVSVCISTDNRLDGRSSIPGRGKGFFSIPQRSERLWGPPNLLNEYWALLPWE
jgi:hypothetical protein